MINWNKYFEHIVVISASKYKERREILDKEFARVSITNYEFFCNIMDNLLSEKILLTNINRKCCLHAHYFVIKRAYELGWDSVFIFEDDIRFLKDESKMQQLLDEFESRKSISNVYMFDYIFWKFDYENIEDPMMAEYFGAASYWLDRKGMKYFIYMMEHWPVINDTWFLFFLSDVSSCDLHYTFINNDVVYPLHIVIPENSVLPCKMNKSSERLCIQYEDGHVSKYYKSMRDEDMIYNTIDGSLYNLEDFE